MCQASHLGCADQIKPVPRQNPVKNAGLSVDGLWIRLYTPSGDHHRWPFPGIHDANHETIPFRCAPSAPPLPQILFVYNTIDDFVMNNLKTYAGRPIKSAEAEDIELGGDDAGAKDDDEEAAAAGLSADEAEDLCSWLKESALAERVRCRLILLFSPSFVGSWLSQALTLTRVVSGVRPYLWQDWLVAPSRR